MVPTTSIISMFVTLALSLFLPIIFLLILRKGRKGVFGVWVAGALGFIVPQLVIRLQILQYFSTMPEFQLFVTANPTLYVTILALTAALFETTGRYIVLKFGLAKELSYMTGLAAGAGHGGIEAITVVGMLYINNLVVSFYINANRLTELIPGDPAMAESIRQSLKDTSASLFLMAGFERVFAMVFQIALSLLLTWFIVKSKAVTGFVLVAGLHFLIDFVASFMQIKGASAVMIEGLLLVVALMALVLIIRIKPHFGNSQSIPTDAGEQAVDEGY